MEQIMYSDAGVEHCWLSAQCIKFDVVDDCSLQLLMRFDLWLQGTQDEIAKAVGDARAVVDSGDAEEIKAKVSALQQVVMKIGEEISKKSGGADPNQGSGPETSSNSTEEEKKQ